MALRQSTVDILDVLNDSSAAVDIQTPNALAIHLASTYTLTNSQIDQAIRLFAGTDDIEEIQCSIDLENRILHINRSDHGLPATTSLSAGIPKLRGTIESEKAAAVFASRLCVFDCDDLVPQCRIDSDQACTYLHMANLCYVSHNALARQIPESCIAFEYSMSAREVVVRFALVNKRKR